MSRPEDGALAKEKAIDRSPPVARDSNRGISQGGPGTDWIYIDAKENKEKQRMNPSNDTANNTTFLSRLRAALERSVMRNTLPADKPYIPSPDQSLPNPTAGISADYSETEAEIQNIRGTAIAFGTQRTIQIDAQGRARDLTQKESFLIGGGKHVSSIEEIGGVCCFCQAQAMKVFHEGKISLEQAQLQSLFDKNSAMQCSICGISTCAIHSRPAQTDEGVVVLCSACRDELSRQQRRKRLLSLLLSPFTEDDPE